MGTNSAVTVAAGSARQHLGSTALGAANPTEPSLAEVQTYVSAQGIKNAIVLYTGTDLATDTPTHVYSVDSASEVVVYKEPPVIAPLPVSTLPMTTNQTLSTWKRFYNITSASGDFTVTMPAASTADNYGDVLEIFNGSDRYITIELDAGDTLVGGMTPLVIQPNGAVTVKSIFPNSIAVIGAGRSIVTSNTAQGFAILGEDLMFQWGTHVLTSDDAHVLSFHTAFGATPHFFTLHRSNEGANSGSNEIAIDMSSATTTSIEVNPANTASAPGDLTVWFAIGKAP